MKPSKIQRSIQAIKPLKLRSTAIPIRKPNASEISHEVGSGKAFIDANQCWNIKEATLFLRDRSCKLDYIEEPIYDIENLKYLQWPIALDETLWEIGLDACLDTLTFRL